MTRNILHITRCRSFLPLYSLSAFFHINYKRNEVALILNSSFWSELLNFTSPSVPLPYSDTAGLPCSLLTDIARKNQGLVGERPVIVDHIVGDEMKAI